LQDYLVFKASEQTALVYICFYLILHFGEFANSESPYCPIVV